MRDKGATPNVDPMKADSGTEKKAQDVEQVIPKEHADDMMVFPGNKYFKSQSVLSEALRDEVWRRVREDGKTVREVSAELGVDMRRVGAVVRLKAVEENWIKEVSLALCVRTSSLNQLYVGFNSMV